MFIGRDNEAKMFYLKIIYDYVFQEFNESIINNKDIPNDYNILSGYIIVIEFINLSEPSFFRNSSIYCNLINNLLKCSNSNNINIVKEFIKFIPDLYYINKNEFKTKYEKQILDFINSLLNRKTNNEIRNQLLLTIGKLSYIIKDDGHKIIINQFFSLIIYLISDKNILDDELLKCLSDLLNSKKTVYLNLIKTIDIFALLPRIFKTFLSQSKIDYLISIMKYYDNDSIENVSTAIISLNAISYIIFEEKFTLDHFKRATFNKKKYINQRLISIVMNMKADFGRYKLEQNFDNFEENHSFDEDDFI
jgi:hypothetical protein